MKKLIFKGNLRDQVTVSSIIKEVNRIPCRISFDLENGIVLTVDNVSEESVDNVIDLVNKYYSTLSIDVDNTAESQECKESDDTMSVSSKTMQIGTKQSETQSENNLIIKKDGFQSEYMQEHINRLLRTISWALNNEKATEKELGRYILTCTSEISMRYSLTPIINFSIGDIVDVNYGCHLPGEIIGGHVHAIVCDVLNNDMAYVVPITKAREGVSSRTYMRICAPRDATYNNEFCTGGIVLVDKGKYVRGERFNCVIGKTTPKFLKRLLEILPEAFDFTRNISDIDEEPNGVKDSKTSKETKTLVGKQESAIINAIGDAFEKLDKNNPLSEQIAIFLKDIGMTTSEKLIMQSFEVACDAEKIDYENIINELFKNNPDVSKESIKIILKKIFKSWLEKYPELAENCPNISLMSILKVFVKKIRIV